MTIHYETNCEQYVMYRDGAPVTKPMDEIAIVYEIDSEDGLVTRHKHGEVERVRAWFDETKQKLSQQGEWGRSMANDLKLWVGKPDLRTLNEAIEGSQTALKNIVCQDLVIDVQARIIDASNASSEPVAASVEEEQGVASAPATARGFRRFSRP